MWKSKFYGAFVLNHRVVLHAIDATPARWRGDACSSPLDRARTAASSPRNDLVKNFWVHPTLVDFHTGKKYSGEAWAHRGKRPYRHVGPPDASTVDGLFRVENAFHRALRPGATLHTSLLGT